MLLLELLQILSLIVKIEISTADVYTITFQGGAVAKYNADGTAA